MKSRKEFQAVFSEIPKIQILTAYLRDRFPYQVPRRYPKWDEILTILAVSVDAATNEEETLKMDVCQLAHQYSHWVACRSPLYCLSEELLSDLLCSDIDNRIINNIEIPLESFMVLFPKTKICESEGAIDHLVFNLLEETINGKVKIHFAFGTTSIDGYSWLGNFYLGEEQGVEPNYRHNKSGEKFLMSKEETEFTRVLKMLAIQILLTLDSRSGLVSDSIPKSIIRQGQKGFAPLREEPQKKFPRWIGERAPQNGKQRILNHQASRHYKQSEWQRRGHWRLQPYGSRKNPQYKLIRIRPTRVAPKTSETN